MKRFMPGFSLLLVTLPFYSLNFQQAQPLDLLLSGGTVLDGTGNPWSSREIGIRGDRIVYVGRPGDRRVPVARETVDARGLVILPGFWDVHSHAALESSHGKLALPLLYQGVTTVVLGVDGDGTNNLAEIFSGYRSAGIAVNALRYVGHGAARSAVMGEEDRSPTEAEMQRMKAYVARGMEEGALGLSTGLFYSPGFFATTGEVIEIAKVAASYGGSYDTHDRDLGASYKGIGYLESIREGITIGERAGLPVIFSHFNAQGIHNYGRAVEGARLIEDARARGVDVKAGQHVYTSTNSNLVSYAIPRWAAAKGRDAMIDRIHDPAQRARLLKEIPEMLEIRGGPERLVFSDLDPLLNGRTLGAIAREWNIPPAEAVLRIVEKSDAAVMNRDLYDPANTEYLATRDWMMTCTDGETPVYGKGIVHPRSYGGFSRKIRSYVLEKPVISLPFAVRGMTSLAADFYGVPDRGLVKQGFFADLAVLDLAKVRDTATYENPHQYAEGTVHVLVNGQFAVRNGHPTGILAGRPIVPIR